MTPPLKISIPSSDEVLEFVDVQVINKVSVVNYRYVKAFEKVGLILPLSQEQLEKSLKNETFKPL